MNEKIIGIISAGAILLSAGWLYKSDILTDERLLLIVVVVLIVGIAYRIFARQFARKAVLKRRRFYKELWRRLENSDNPDDLINNKAEEECVVLLGRIKMATPMTIVMTVATVAALSFKVNHLALVAALGQIYLAAKLHWIVHDLDRKIPADVHREIDVRTPESASDNYIVAIDLSQVHDFIRPTLALPFWDLIETKLWLSRCGFRWIGGRNWVAPGKALVYLDPGEVIAIHSAGDNQ